MSLAAVARTGEKAVCNECMMCEKCNINTKGKQAVWVDG